MSASVAYVAAGRLHLKSGDQPARAVDSRFGEEIRERALSIDRRHSWKAQGRGAEFMSGRLLWGGAEDASSAVRMRYGSLGSGTRPGEILYTLETREIVALLALDTVSGQEARLFHANDRRVGGVASAPGSDAIVCTVAHSTGVTAIGCMEADATGLRELTEGDSVDDAPSPVPGRRAVVFHSAGIGRDREGNRVALGPCEIRELDLEGGAITTLAASAQHDLLGPRVAADGSLFYIRRPYRAATGATFWGATRDFLLFPVRLLHAVFSYLNFFATRYTGKPLTTAGGPEQKGADLRQMMVWGNLIHARDDAKDGGDAPDLVPASWQLVRQRGSEAPEVVAKGVLAFDLDADGRPVYSNGSAVFAQAADGSRVTLLKQRGIEQLVVVR